jgi:sec-independent protein translocase protein TatA
MFGMGTSEIILILVVILVLFGARKIPEFAKGLGQGIREFKNAANNVKTEIESSAKEQPKPVVPVTPAEPNTDKTLS